MQPSSLSLLWVMGAAAPMAPPKGADQPQQPNQMNQTKEREWNETKRKKAILFHESINWWMKRMPLPLSLSGMERRGKERSGPPKAFPQQVNEIKDELNCGGAAGLLFFNCWVIGRRPLSAEEFHFAASPTAPFHLPWFSFTCPSEDRPAPSFSSSFN